ncbi:tRNA-dihydrouridine synthase [Catenovulum adriaticum]|uniref:tRNA-dihydrouridine(16) synthase n=1 Tax=Catenovulum adriaticum TaxID=2984846 RepID=A0ABY7ANV2_9ALTE|nr:tRNA-dihydrouridine synthase [Catenovulum sp. TS8]WAJ70821.1 tRNA-dihydrouridine synthase [Catenovulum sp. TS8]
MIHSDNSQNTIERLTLAPMEGVVDHLMRDMLTQAGGFDLCVTEFIRVTDALLPKRVFYRLCPELHQAGKTPSGTPVRIQLLGNDPELLAVNALRAIELGSHGVDVNFGCPAKTVNKSKGGAVLLQEPETLFKVMKAIRETVPKPHVVSAKIRLGFDDAHLFHENVNAIQAAGVNELAIHARTKRHGYKPPAYWHEIKTLESFCKMPITANGEIWNAEDAQSCIAASGAHRLMLGRGALAVPNLAACIRYGEDIMPWDRVLGLLQQYAGYEISGDQGLYYPNRVKQWLTYLRIAYPQAQTLFTQIKKLKTKVEILPYFEQSVS